MSSQTRLEPKLRTAIEHLLGAHPEMGHLRERIARIHRDLAPEIESVVPDKLSWPTE